MANIKRIYQRHAGDGQEIVTIMAYIGADVGDRDEIRRIIEHNNVTVEDKIAYFGTAGTTWLEEQDGAYTADGFQRTSDGTY